MKTAQIEASHIVALDLLHNIPNEADTTAPNHLLAVNEIGSTEEVKSRTTIDGENADMIYPSVPVFFSHMSNDYCCLLTISIKQKYFFKEIKRKLSLFHALF